MRALGVSAYERSCSCLKGGVSFGVWLQRETWWIGSTKRRLLLQVLLWGHEQKDGAVFHTNNLKSSPALAQTTCQDSRQTQRRVRYESELYRLTVKHAELPSMPTSGSPAVSKNTQRSMYGAEQMAQSEPALAHQSCKLKKERGCKCYCKAELCALQSSKLILSASLLCHGCSSPHTFKQGSVHLLKHLS